jgi:hypothetical protein
LPAFEQDRSRTHRCNRDAGRSSSLAYRRY